MDDADIETFKYILSTAPENYSEWEWDFYMITALREFKDIELFKYILSKVPENYVISDEVRILM